MLKFFGFFAILIFSIYLIPVSFAEHNSEHDISWLDDIDRSVSYNEHRSVIYDIEDMCDSSKMIYLNHTITNGTLKGICSVYIAELYFEIEADDDGVLLLDIPKDVFDRKYYEGYDGEFNVDVYSTKYTTYDDRKYVDRFYIPPVYEKNTGITQSYERYVNDNYILQCVNYDVENDVCLKWFDESLIYKDYAKGLTFEEFYKVYKNKHLNKFPEIEHLIVTKIKSTDTFDRFKIPFLKDDYLFHFGYEQVHADPVDTTQYSPYKYTNPIPQITNTATEISDPTTENEPKSLCRADLVPVSKPNIDRNLCVKNTTAEKLQNRGWILVN